MKEQRDAAVLENEHLRAILEKIHGLSLPLPKESFSNPKISSHKKRPSVTTPPTTSIATSSSLSNSTTSLKNIKGAVKDPMLLHNACFDSNLELVNKLIEEAYDINYRDKNNWTPLHCCASTGQLDICETLLRRVYPIFMLSLL
jgi:ankyrin repeat protein